MSDNEPHVTRQDAIFDPVLLSIAVIWGANFPVYKRLMEDIAPVGLLAVRFAGMTTLLLVILAATGRLRSTPRKMWLPVLLAGNVHGWASGPDWPAGAHRAGPTLPRRG